MSYDATSPPRRRMIEDMTIATGIYMVPSLFWLWAMEGTRPDRSEYGWRAVCLAGEATMLLGPRA